MASENDSQQTEILLTPGDEQHRTAATSVDRLPLVYGPKAPQEINQSRLPPPEALADMELAFREPLSLADLVNRSLAAFSTSMLMVAATISFAITGLAAYMPAGYVSPLTPIVAIALVIGLIFIRRATTVNIVLALLISFGLPALLRQLYPAMGSRFSMTVLLSLATFLLFGSWGEAPFAFYLRWVRTHPRLTPEDRRNATDEVRRPDQGLIGVLLLAVVFGPRFSPFWTFVGIIAFFSFVAYSITGILQILFRELRMIVRVNFLYGVNSTLAPGTWRPSPKVAYRIITCIAPPLALALTLSVGLNLFFPWDAPYFRDIFINLHPGLSPQEISDKPAQWLTAMVYGGADNPLLAWTYSIAVILCVAVSLIVTLATYGEALSFAFLVRARIDGEIEDSEEEEKKPDNRCEWEWYLDRIRTSAHSATEPLGSTVREAEHLFMGLERDLKYPVLLDRAILREHCYIAGETGSGKTSLGLMPLLTQLIRGHADKDGDITPVPPIVILDLKGDPALFNTVKEEVEARASASRRWHGDIFRFFTPEPRKISHYFNPFDSLKSDSRSVVQLCNIMIDSLSLSHGEGYGRSYYTRKSRAVLLDALKSATPNNLKELAEALANLRKQKKGDYEEAFELVSTIQTLTEYPQLLTTPGQADADPDHCIHMPTLLAEGQVAYFWLPAALESISVREIAKLALYCLLTAAIDRQAHGKPPVQTYLVIDEFQRIAGENFKIILEQARSFGLSAILANQTQSDLATADTDLRPTIRTNTRVKMFFSISDHFEMDALSRISGEELAFSKGWSLLPSLGSSGQVRSYSEVLKPRLTKNDIIAISDHPLDYILHVSRGSGYTQYSGFPIPVRTTWSMHEDTYKRRASAQWPRQAEQPRGLAKGAKEPKEIDRQHSERVMRFLQEASELAPRYPELQADQTGSQEGPDKTKAP